MVVTILLSVVLLLPPSAALADEQAGSYKQRAAEDFNGFTGHQGIRTNPATVNGVGFVHFSQIDIGALLGDFVAVGTANGAGLPGTGCANDYDPDWTVYTDGQIGGVYFCVDENLDAYGANTNPEFSITYGFCPSQSANRWLLSFGGTVWSCKNANPTGGSRVSVALETVGASTADRNIDVKFNTLQRRTTGGSYVDFGASGSDVVDPSYTVTHPSSTQVFAYLAPLD